jgi:hypothetical protein
MFVLAMAQKRTSVLIGCFLCQEHVLLLLEEIHDHHTHLLPLNLPLPLPMLRCLDKESTAQPFSKVVWSSFRVELAAGRNLGRKS